MNARISSITLFVLLSLIISGCSNPGPLYKQKRIISASIPIKQYELKINDNRGEGNQILFVPNISVPGQKDQSYPQVNDKLIDIVNKVVQEVMVPGDKNLIIEININKGYKEFRANVFSEVEKTYCEISTKLIDSGTKAELKSGKGICWGQKESLDASQRNLEKMWIQTFERALIQSFNNLEDVKN